jgi:hypothetical protein
MPKLPVSVLSIIVLPASISAASVKYCSADAETLFLLPNTNFLLIV